jgi:hypothetical protein
MRHVRRFLPAEKYSGIRQTDFLIQMSLNEMIMKIRGIFLFFFMTACLASSAQSIDKNRVRLVQSEEKKRVDVIINGKLFTSFLYPSNIEKPILFPVISPDGSVLTRGYPLEPRKGERMDHPHHMGMWFNYGSVNGLDFWNNSSAIPADKKDQYGHIVLDKINTVAGGKRGILEVYLKWEDSRGSVLLNEDATYIFTGDNDSRTIDHISTLTAVNGPVVLGDSKEGLFAIRVDRAFEMPSGEALIFTDDKGNPTTVEAIDNTGVSGMYTSANGKKGDAVWGTRNEWVMLSGIKNDKRISMLMLDHPKNPGFPAYAHARGYGLFSINNFGSNSYDPGQQKASYTIAKGESLTLHHRFFIKAGKELTAEEANKIFRIFSKEY